MALPQLLAARKRIPVDAEWVKPNAPDGYTFYNVPLEVNGIIETSVNLQVGTYAAFPDRHVTFELAILGLVGQRRTRIDRVDWRDIRDGHTNPRSCRGPWAGRRVPASHAHSFSLNYVVAEQRMKKRDLPCAEPLIPDPQSYEALRQMVGTRWNINNIDVVPRPPWVYDLFT